MQVFTKNKRQFLRLGAHHLLKYKLLDEQGKEGTLSFVRNISAGGVLFHSNEHIKPGSSLELDISFPPSPDSIKIRAKVLRVSKLKTVDGFDVAVQFLNLDKDIKKFIDSKIENIIYKTKEDDMKTLAAIFIIFAAIAGIIALSTRFNLIPVIFFGAPTWLSIANTALFFSIAISLVKNKTNS
jgi:hypothetical protein